jgi:hypothetical protein
VAAKWRRSWNLTPNDADPARQPSEGERDAARSPRSGAVRHVREDERRGRKLGVAGASTVFTSTAVSVERAARLGVQ